MANGGNHLSSTERLAWTVEEVMAKLGIGRTLIYDLIAQGKIGSVKAGGRRLISQQHLEQFLAGE